MPVEQGNFMHDWLMETVAQVRNAAPIPLAYLADHASWITLDSMTNIFVFAYAVGQLAYLVWKWRNEARRYVRIPEAKDVVAITIPTSKTEASTNETN